MGATSTTLLPVSCVQDKGKRMSNNYSEPDDDGDEDFKNLRAKAKRADQLERENATLKRDIAFVKAGIPMEDPRMGYFVKGYEGDLDPDSIKQAAVDAGFIAATPAPADPALDQARAGQQRVLAASSGTEPVDDGAGIMFGMQQAYAEGDLEGLSAFTQQYGVTFNPESL
jgi:ribosomal protein L12E/L44/L45/RPP1/RPP2